MSRLDDEKQLCFVCGRDVGFDLLRDPGIGEPHAYKMTCVTARGPHDHYLCRDCHDYHANVRQREAAEKWWQLLKMLRDKD